MTSLMADNHPTEAECLLEQGATYHRRIGFEPVGSPGEPIFAGFKTGAFSLYFGDAPIYHFDLEGRWQRAFVNGVHYLKGLDASIHAIDRMREGSNLVLKRRSLSYAEASDLDAMVRSTALDLCTRLDAKSLDRVEPKTPMALALESDELRDFLDRISMWDASAWFAHRERYLSAYGPLPLSPPECQNAVVVQATLGHATGVAFGGATESEAYTRTTAEFTQHTRNVARIWGRRLLQSRIVFLAGADVLHQPVEQVAAYLSEIGSTFPIEPRTQGRTMGRSEESDNPRFDGIHVFRDNFALPRPDRAGWHELTKHGLVRISLGVESGHADVRSIYRKHWDDADLRATVAESKAAGLGVSVLTLVGAGGVERAESHVERTVRLIELLELGAGDFVFLLDEKEIRTQNLEAEHMTFLSRQAWSDQQSELKVALTPLRKKGVKVLPYTMEKQWQ
jgi:hypothetical protein